MPVKVSVLAAPLPIEPTYLPPAAYGSLRTAAVPDSRLRGEAAQ